MTFSKLVAGEVAGTYNITGPVTEVELLQIAKSLATRRLAKGRKLTLPSVAFDYLQVLLQDKEREAFCAVFLDSQHRVICFEEIFLGTIDSISVHPREVVKRALSCNAAAVILAHNHPNGDPSPSDADLRVTLQLKSALELMEVAVIDHIIVGSDGYSSFAEMGYL